MERKKAINSGILRTLNNSALRRVKFERYTAEPNADGPYSIYLTFDDGVCSIELDMFSPFNEFDEFGRVSIKSAESAKHFQNTMSYEYDGNTRMSFVCSKIDGVHIEYDCGLLIEVTEGNGVDLLIVAGNQSKTFTVIGPNNRHYFGSGLESDLSSYRFINIT